VSRQPQAAPPLWGERPPPPHTPTQVRFRDDGADGGRGRPWQAPAGDGRASRRPRPATSSDDEDAPRFGRPRGGGAGQDRGQGSGWGGRRPEKAGFAGADGGRPPKQQQQGAGGREGGWSNQRRQRPQPRE
jgi:hypothetical protein